MYSFVSRLHTVKKYRLTSVLIIYTFSSALAWCQTAPKGGDTFQKVRILVQGGGEVHETNFNLRFDSDQLSIVSVKDSTVMKVFPYTSIRSATYSYSKSRRWEGGAGTAGEGVFVLPLLFLKTKKHWLVVRTDSDRAVLRLDKENYKMILGAFEARTAVKVEIRGEGNEPVRDPIPERSNTTLQPPSRARGQIQLPNGLLARLAAER